MMITDDGANTHMWISRRSSTQIRISQPAHAHIPTPRTRTHLTAVLILTCERRTFSLRCDICRFVVRHVTRYVILCWNNNARIPATAGNLVANYIVYMFVLMALLSHRPAHHIPGPFTLTHSSVASQFYRIIMWVEQNVHCSLRYATLIFNPI